ncbi:hypothetical protein GGI00_000610, partial [Coemansia sp. RSA 2681]
YGRKKKGKKTVKMISLETIDSTSAFINPFTRADFPFGLMTPPVAPTPTTKDEPKTTRKTIKKMLSVKTSSSAAPLSTSTGAQINASLGKDGGITIVANNLSQATSSSTVVPGTTIIIPPASLTSSASNASSASSSAAPASSSSISIHEDSTRNDDVKANEVARHAHTISASPDMNDSDSVKGNRREAATAFDPLASSASASPVTAITDIAQATNMREAMESPVGTIGSSSEWHAESSATPASAKHRKMHVVRVFEVKKNKSSLISGASSSAQSSSAQSSPAQSSSAQSSSAESMQKRDVMPLYDAPESTSMLENNPMETPLLIETYSTEFAVPNTLPIEPARMAPSVSNWQRMAKESANDNDSESDSDDDSGTKKLDSDAEKVRDILSQSKDNVSPTVIANASASPAAVESSSASAGVESSSALASVESSSATAGIESSSVSASVESSSVSASVESSSALASAESSSVSGDVKVEATPASTSASGESGSASTSAQSTKAVPQSTSSVSAQSTSSISAQSTSSISAQSTSSVSAHSTSSLSAKKSGTTTMMTSSRSSLSIEDIGAQETSVERGNASEEARSGKKDDSDSDSDSEGEGESGVEKVNEDKERDASEEGDSEDSDNESDVVRDEDNESEAVKDEDSDDEKASPRSKVGSRGRLATNNDGDSLMAIQRVAALGLREAEKAVEEFEKNSDAPGVEILTTEDDKPAAIESSSSSAAAESAESASASASASEMSATQSLAAAQSAASQSVASALSLAMSSLDHHAAEAASTSPVRAAAQKDRDDDSDDDKDSDDEKRSKKEDSDDESDSGSDDDSDSDSDKKKKKKPSSNRNKSISGENRQESRGEYVKEADRALSEAAAESAQQAVKATATKIDAMATDSASADSAGDDNAERMAMSEAASESTKQAVMATATELDAMATDSASAERIEFETSEGVNADGESVQFVTQLIADNDASDADEDDVVVSHSRVQRNAVDEEVEVADPTIVRDGERRALNVGAGNLRRRV